MLEKVLNYPKEWIILINIYMVTSERRCVQMNKFILRLLRLFLALVLYAVGVVLTLQANIGYASWDVFHAGLSKIFDAQIGTVSIFAGLVICIIVVLAGEKIGLGTLCNMVFIGLFVNIFLSIEVFPTLTNFYFGLLQMFVGLFIIALATYYYISSAFGAGPRDSLMVVLTKKTKLSVGVCRSGLEIFIVIIGALLGGSFGIGTILAAVTIGFFVQIAFKMFRFDPTTIVHESFMDTLRNIPKLREPK